MHRLASPRSSVAFLVAFLLFTPSILVDAQFGEGDQFDLSITMDLPDAIVVGEQNELRGIIRNAGDFHTDAVVLVSVCDATRCRGAEPAEYPERIPPNQPVEIVDTWSNQAPDGSADLTGPLTVTMEVLEENEWMIHNASRGAGGLVGQDPEERYEEARSAGDDAWDDESAGVAGAKGIAEDALFEDGPAAAEWVRPIWDTTWRILDREHEEAGEEIPHNRPVRTDPHPSDNRQTATVDVVKHATQVNLDTTGYPEDINASKGEEATAVLEIYNRGVNVSDGSTPLGSDHSNPLLLSLQDASPGWTFNLSKTTVAPVNDGQPEYVFLDMQAPPDAFVGDEGHVNVVVSSDIAPLTSGSIISVTSPPVAAFGTIESALSVNQAVLDPREHVSTSYELHVDNKRNEALTIIPEAVPPTTGNWTMGITPTSHSDVAPGDRVTFDVAVTVPHDAVAGKHTFQSIVGYTNGTSSLDTIKAPNFTINVLPWWEVDFVDPLDIPSKVNPGEYLSNPVAFTVHNKGNAPDDFQVSLKKAPGGWTLVNSTGDPVPPFEVDINSTVSVTDHYLKVPAAVKKDHYEVDFLVKSQTDSTVHNHTNHFIQVADKVLPRITLNAPSSSCIPATEDLPSPMCGMAEDRSLDIPLTLHNDGNAEGTFALTASVVEGGPHSGWSVSFNDTEVTLGSEKSSPITMTVESPDVVELDPSDRAAVTLRLATDTGDEEDLEDLVAIAAFPELALDISGTSPSPLYKTVDGDLLLTVHNKGLAPAGAFDVEVTYSKEGTPIGDPTTVSVSSGLPKGASAPLAITIPTWEETSTMTASVEVNPSGSGSVKEYPAGHELSRANDDSLPMSLRTFAVEIDGLENRKADPGQEISLKGSNGFLVKNLGSHTETLDISLDATWSQAEGAWPSQSIGTGNSSARYFGTEFFVPERPESLTAILTLHVNHPDHAELHAKTSFTIRVNDTQPPEITVDPPAKDAIKVGETLRVDAAIDDLTGIESARLIVTTPTGATSHVDMVHGKGSEYYALQQFNAVGVYKWHVWAQDNSSHRHQSDTQATPHSINVTPASLPRLVLVSPSANEPIRPGEDVVVSVFNTSGIQSVQASVQGVNQTLPVMNPIFVSTDDWDDGVTNLTLRVTDSFGSLVEESFFIQIDGTNPTIGSARFEGTERGEPTTATVHVTDNMDVASVKLRVDAEGNGIAVDVPMNLTGDHNYTTETTYPHAEGSVTVIAVDKVGNSASKILIGPDSQDPALDEGGQSRLLPGPGTATVMSLIFALLIGVRRQNGPSKEGRP